MDRKLSILVWICMTTLVGAQLVSTGSKNTWQEVTAESMDKALLTEYEKRILNMDISWNHAQTEHFVIHYEQAIFATKVARMAEDFYAIIGADLKGFEDKTPGRSHIFIFRNQKKWDELKQAANIKDKWMISFVRGYHMCLQQMGNTSSSGDILAHEMTHMVVNRYLPKRLPLWLNEGLAEFYEEFAYAEHKGLKKSRRAQFKRLNDMYPLEKLLAAKDYPDGNERVIHSFYETSKFMTGFLLLDQPVDNFLRFLKALMDGRDAQESFAEVYGWGRVEDIEKAFMKFAK